MSELQLWGENRGVKHQGTMGLPTRWLLIVVLGISQSITGGKCHFFTLWHFSLAFMTSILRCSVLAFSHALTLSTLNVWTWYVAKVFTLYQLSESVCWLVTTMYHLYLDELQMPPCSQPKPIKHGMSNWDGRGSTNAKFACFQVRLKLKVYFSYYLNILTLVYRS